jgi:hypothetical protein
MEREIVIEQLEEESQLDRRAGDALDRQEPDARGVAAGLPSVLKAVLNG